MAQDGKYFTLGEDPKALFLLLCTGQNLGRQPRSARAHASPSPRSSIPVVRRAVADLRPRAAGRRAQDHGHRSYSFATMPARMMAAVIGTFAAVALLLAGRRSLRCARLLGHPGLRELALRMALGARPADVVRQVVRRGMSLAGIGLAIGLVGAVAVGRLIASLVYGVSPSDPVVYGIALVVLAAVSFLAAFIPAVRASIAGPPPPRRGRRGRRSKSRGPARAAGQTRPSLSPRRHPVYSRE